MTSITNGDDTELNTDYVVLYPATGPPYLWCELSWQGNPFVGDGFGNRQCLEVVGKWGYCNAATLPDAIKRATLMLTNWLYKNPEAAAKSVGPARVGQDDIMDMIPAAVLIILDSYIREWFGSHDMWISQTKSFAWYLS